MLEAFDPAQQEHLRFVLAAFELGECLKPLIKAVVEEHFLPSVLGEARSYAGWFAPFSADDELERIEECCTLPPRCASLPSRSAPSRPDASLASWKAPKTHPAPGASSWWLMRKRSTAGSADFYVQAGDLRPRYPDSGAIPNDVELWAADCGADRKAVGDEITRRKHCFVTVRGRSASVLAPSGAYDSGIPCPWPISDDSYREKDLPWKLWFEILRARGAPKKYMHSNCRPDLWGDSKDPSGLYGAWEMCKLFLNGMGADASRKLTEQDFSFDVMLNLMQVLNVFQSRRADDVLNKAYVTRCTYFGHPGRLAMSAAESVSAINVLIAVLDMPGLMEGLNTLPPTFASDTKERLLRIKGQSMQMVQLDEAQKHFATFQTKIAQLELKNEELQREIDKLLRDNEHFRQREQAQIAKQRAQGVAHIFLSLSLFLPM